MVWSSIAEICAKLVAPITNMILARLLTPGAFGAVATITLVISFAEIFTDAGFQKYIIQHEFSSEEELDRNTNVAFWTNFCTSVFIVALIVAFRHFLADLVGSPDLGDAIAVASMVIILVSFSSIQIARFKRAFDFKTLFFVRIGSSLIPLVVTVPLALVFRNFWALVLGTLAVNLFSTVVLMIKSKWHPTFAYDFACLKNMLSFSAWTLLETILIWLTTHVDIFIVGRILSDYHLGLYRTSMTTINSYMSLITASITPVLFATLSRYQNDEGLFKETYWKFFKYTSIISIPMSVGIFLYKDLVTLILLGEQWAEATGFIGIWGLMSGFTIILCNYSSEVYRSKGNPKLSMLAQILHMAFLIPAVLLTVNQSFETLYITRALVRLQFVLVHWIFMRAVYKFKISKMFVSILPAGVSALVMLLMGYVWLWFGTAFWWQLLGVGVCVIVYFGVLFLVFPKTRKEILALPILKKIKRKITKR